MYSFSCITLRTRPISFDAGRITQSVLPAASAFRIVTMASLRASCNMASLSCTSGSRARRRSRGNIAGRGGARTGERCPACGRTAGNLASGRSLSSVSHDHLDLEAILHELHAFVTCDAMPPRDPRSEEHTSELQSRFDLVC